MLEDAGIKLSSVAADLKRLAEQAQASPGIAAPAGNLLANARIKPEYDGERMVGISFSAIQPGSPLDQIGLEDGDRVSQINGLELDDPSALQKIATALSASDRISITVNGQPRVVDTGQIADLQPSPPQ